MFIKNFSAHKAYGMSGPSFGCWLNANYEAPYFKRVHKILRKGLLASSCPSIRPAPTGRIFVKPYFEFFFFFFVKIFPPDSCLLKIGSHITQFSWRSAVSYVSSLVVYEFSVREIEESQRSRRNNWRPKLYGTTLMRYACRVVRVKIRPCLIVSFSLYTNILLL